MMDAVRQWLTGLTCVALVAALADGIMPKGAIRQVGKLVCALVLLCALLRPLFGVRGLEGGEAFGGIAAEMEQQRLRLEEESGQLLKTLIEQESAAYIVDKAAELGLACWAQVTCAVGEGGAWLPCRADISGVPEGERKAKLSAAIQRELGIAPECQQFTGGEVGETEHSGEGSGLEGDLGSL